MKPHPLDQIRFLFGNQPGFEVEETADAGIINVHDRETGRRYEVSVTEFTA